MSRLIQISEATAARRRVYFQLVDATDFATPETGEAGGQPQISTNGGSWTNTGIGTLTHIGNGRYYADLTAGAVGTAGDWIETRYKSANTAECPGDSVQVVTGDPADVPTAIMERAITGESGVTVEQCLQELLAVNCNEKEKDGTTVNYKNRNGSRTRVSGTVNSRNERSNMSYDHS